MKNGAFATRLRAATELLESIVRDRTLLAAVSSEERARLLHAAGQVSRPDAPARRRLLKTMQRQHKAAKLERDERIRAETGIRALRRAAVFTTPNVFPPAGSFEPETNEDS